MAEYFFWKKSSSLFSKGGVANPVYPLLYKTFFYFMLGANDMTGS